MLLQLTSPCQIATYFQVIPLCTFFDQTYSLSLFVSCMLVPFLLSFIFKVVLILLSTCPPPLCFILFYISIYRTPGRPAVSPSCKLSRYFMSKKPAFYLSVWGTGVDKTQAWCIEYSGQGDKNRFSGGSTVMYLSIAMKLRV